MERKLWAQLKLLDIHGHFRRQSPVGPYFADFAHHHCRLIVELDGDQHGETKAQQHDAKRAAYLEARGYRVLRFWNNEVQENLDGVIETIFAALNKIPPTPSPSPPQAGGGEAAPPFGWRNDI
jgi:very-short-patch-repair endonuclease